MHKDYNDSFNTTAYRATLCGHPSCIY